MKEHRKNIVFIVLLVILFLPFLQHQTALVPVSQLTGSTSQAISPEFRLNKWFSGDFQQQYESAIEGKIGFRSWIVRFKNQLEFSLFRKANASGVVVGKNGYLFESDYIRAYEGLDCLGEWFWNEKFERLALVRDTLNKLGVELALILEPGKASYYPEYIRSRDLKEAVKPSNYDIIIKKSAEKDIPTLDLNAWFVSQKAVSPYPLFPKGGIHWSNYGMVRAVDTLLKFVDKLSSHTIPSLKITDIEETKDLRDTDSDLSEIMNLIWSPSHPPMAYPDFVFTPLPDSVKPRVLSISDSFFFNILNAGIPAQAFANEAFWYYSNSIYPDTWSEPKDTSMINIREEVEKMDIVMLMITERFYYKLAWNFIDHLYKVYYPEEVPDLLYDYCGLIIRNYKWFDQVYSDAMRKHISMETSLRDNAFYQFWRDDQDGKLQKNAAYYVMKIRQDPAWYHQVAKKAEKNGISVKKQLVLDGLWLENQDGD